jgi:hypothetical protein
MYVCMYVYIYMHTKKLEHFIGIRIFQHIATIELLHIACSESKLCCTKKETRISLYAIRHARQASSGNTSRNFHGVNRS